MYQHCAGQSRAIKLGRLDIYKRKSDGAQVVADVTENVNELWRWTDPSLKGCPVIPVTGTMAVHFVSMWLSSASCGMSTATEPTRLMGRLAELTCSLPFHKHSKLGSIDACALAIQQVREVGR